MLHDLITRRRMLQPDPRNWRLVALLMLAPLLALAALTLA